MRKWKRVEGADGPRFRSALAAHEASLLHSLVTSMLGMLDEEFAALHASSETERHQLTVERDRIQDQRRASLQAHYAGALPLDLLKEEQDRLARQLDLVTARLDALDST